MEELNNSLSLIDKFEKAFEKMCSGQSTEKCLDINSYTEHSPAF